MGCGVRNPPRFVLEASGVLYALIPERGDGAALEDGGDDESHARCDDPRVQHVAGNAEGLGRDSKDPIVEANDGQLGEHQNDFVDDVGAVKPFACRNTRVHRQ